MIPAIKITKRFENFISGMEVPTGMHTMIRYSLNMQRSLRPSRDLGYFYPTANLATITFRRWSRNYNADGKQARISLDGIAEVKVSSVINKSASLDTFTPGIAYTR
jgi:hypothetical protein